MFLASLLEYLKQGQLFWAGTEDIQSAIVLWYFSLPSSSYRIADNAQIMPLVSLYSPLHHRSYVCTPYKISTSENNYQSIQWKPLSDLPLLKPLNFKNLRGYTPEILLKLYISHNNTVIHAVLSRALGWPLIVRGCIMWCLSLSINTYCSSV